MKDSSRKRYIAKTITWRFIGTLDTVILSWVISGDPYIGLKIGVSEVATKMILYYFHERIWQKFKRDKVSRKQTMYKTISWRIVATTITYIISGAVLESFNEVALFIALTELITKFVLYYYHERLWLRLPIGCIRNFVDKKIVKR